MCSMAAQTGARAQAPETLKERLSDKASDLQRLDNCRVPEDRRGAAVRPGCAAEQDAGRLTSAGVRAILADAKHGHGADLSGRSLADLDLSGLDLSGADLHDADLRGAKLVGANLTGANLSGARLNLAWITRANFDHADLSGAVLETLVVSAGLQTTPAEAATFVEANLSGARIMARLSLDDMRGANFSRAKMAADMRNQSMGLIHTDFSSAKLSGANFSAAELGHVSFRFADLTRANLTGADATGADFDGASLRNALGLDAVKGLRTG